MSQQATERPRRPDNWTEADEAEWLASEVLADAYARAYHEICMLASGFGSQENVNQALETVEDLKERLKISPQAEAGASIKGLARFALPYIQKGVLSNTDIAKMITEALGKQ